jgi:hypothetical protein
MARFISHYQGFVRGASTITTFWHTTSVASRPLIRITTQTEGKLTIVTVDGQMTELDLKAIRRVRNSVPRAVVLNLRGLSACAVGGVHFLRAWLEAGAKLQDANPFMEMILKDSSPRSARSQNKE